MYTATASLVISASLTRIWEAMTDPAVIREYLDGVEVTSDWKIGGAITYHGVRDGATLEGKGVILNMVPHELIETTYWSNLWGLPDEPENYKKVTYRLIPVDWGTVVRVIEDNIPTEEERRRAEQQWMTTLQNLKRINIDPARFINKAVITEEIEHFTPEHQFTDFAIGDALKRAVTAKGYVTPTPIQDRAIPHVLKGLDVVGIANTGTGKTAAFLIPLINKVRIDPKAQVLIVVPTRELAIQIESELKGFTKAMKIYSVVCVGGASIAPQMHALKYRNQFVIGTPGRLKDLIERGKIRLADYSPLCSMRLTACSTWALSTICACHEGHAQPTSYALLLCYTFARSKGLILNSCTSRCASRLRPATPLKMLSKTSLR
jgi:uncharacterized protein YndB with AHSA1/START domain